LVQFGTGHSLAQLAHLVGFRMFFIIFAHVVVIVAFSYCRFQ